MPTPHITRAEAERRIAAVNKALSEGYRPPGSPGHGQAALAVAALTIGMARTGMINSLRDIKLHHNLEPDWSLYKPPVRIIELVAPARPKVRIRVGSVDKPHGPEYRVLAIGDPHDSPHIQDNSRFKWIGRYAAENNIPYIRSIGDMGTFDSCSQFEDYGRVSGRMKPSFDTEIRSLEDALGTMVRQFPDGYTPNRKNTKGNHENRVHQWEDQHPEVEGMFGLRLDQALSRAGFDFCEYGEWDFLGGVGFTHVPMNIMGKPYGGKYVENQIANDAMFSIVFGHTHKRNLLPRPKIGPQKRVTILNLGCALPHGHTEPYAAVSTTGWSWGIYDLVIQAGDIQTERFVSMIELERMFG